MASGISAFADGVMQGRERLRENKRQDEDDAWTRRAREREAQGWEHQDKQREREEIDWQWTDDERLHTTERRTATEAHDDRRMQAEGVAFDDTIQHGAQDRASERAHQRTARQMDVESKRLGMAATRQGMSHSAAASARAAESHGWQRTREATIQRQLQANERYMKAVAEIAPLMQSDPQVAATKIAEIVNASGVNGSGKLGIGYDPESGTFAASLMRNGVRTSGGRVTQQQLLDHVRMVVDPVGFGGDFAKRAVDDAARYQDTANDRARWEREQMAELSTSPAHEMPDAADANGDGKVTPAELAAYVKLLGNMVFENTPRYLPGGAPKPAATRPPVAGSNARPPSRPPAGVSNAKPAAGAPVPGARKAPDGNWYLVKEGKTYRVDN